jgi:hypothetical protein
MYFLRRRHGRKPQTDQNRDQRRDRPPATVQASAMRPSAMPPSAMQIYGEPGETVTPRPVVITKARRARPELAEADDCKPAGTFRAGTLHIAARAADAGASHGKL